ncbi:MAG: sulfotransferase [Leptolyngbyaceae cyanobacterium]
MMNSTAKMNLYGYSPQPKTARRIQRQTFLAPLLQFLPAQNNRRFHAYCVGLPRSGTHSFGYMFGSRYSSKHEPAKKTTISHLLRHLSGTYTESQWKALLRCRDLKLGLELESSHYLHHTMAILAEMYPEAKFIHTVREPLSWLASEINQNLETCENPMWRAIERARYERYGFRYAPEEKVLAALDAVWPVASYLSYWRDHNELIMRVIPKDRLLVLRTHEIKHSIDRIAHFLNIHPETINTSASHSGKNSSKKFDLYAHVDMDFVQKKVDLHCGPLVEQLFDKVPQFYLPDKTLQPLTLS